jgi:hypothetical protein
MTILAASASGVGPDVWIVCLGRLREVRAGVVRCPVTRRSVAVARCFGCHRLVDASDERDRASACATGPELS